MTTEQVIEPGARITFENVMTNVGGAYSSGENEVICQQDGFYLFTFSFVSSGNSDGRINIGLFKEGVGQIASTHATSSNGGLSAGNSVIAECSNGQRMWLEGVGVNSNLLSEWSDAIGFCTFSGVLLTNRVE